MGTNLVLPESLATFSADGNLLNGSFPIHFGNLSRLSISNNYLTSMNELGSGLEYLYSGNNQISGHIPTLPIRLLVFRAENNNLIGLLPSLPLTLTYLQVNRNGLSGNLPVLPSLLSYIEISTNYFDGSVPLIPNSLTTIYMSNNNFNGILSPLSTSIRSLYLSNNYELRGNLSLTRPLQVYIQNTKISEFSIADMSSLYACFLDNTPLLGKVDNYTKCSQFNLYSLNATFSSLASTEVRTIDTSSTHIVSTASTLHTERIVSTTNHISTTQFMPLFSTIISTSNQFSIIATTQVKRSTSILLNPIKSILLKSIQTPTSTRQSTYSILIAPTTTSISITFTIYSVIKLCINWGFIIFILSEFKNRRIKKRKIVYSTATDYLG